MNQKSVAWSLFPAATMIWLGFAAMASNQYHTLLLEKHHHLSATAIGSTVALGASSQIVLPWLLLFAGNWFRNADKILRRAYLSLALCLAAFPFIEGQIPAIICYFGIIASMSVGATLQGITIIAAARPKGDSWVLLLRSMGTFGFASSCLLSSVIADHVGYKGLYLVFAFWSIVAIISSKKAGQSLPPDSSPVDLKDTLRRLSEPSTLAVLSAIFLANLAISGATSVLSNFIFNDLGGSKSQVSLAWTIATFAEMPLIWGSIFFLRRFGIKGLILTGFLCSTARMGILSQVDTMGQLYAIQVLHGLFFGASLSGMGLWLAKRHGTDKLQRLQLVSQSLYGGVAAAIGGQATGMIWESFGLRSVYFAAFFTLLLACGILLFAFREQETPFDSK